MDNHSLYAELEKIRQSARKKSIRRIRSQGRLRQRVQSLENQLEDVSGTLAALLSVLEAKGTFQRGEIVAALKALDSQ